jgi:uncharacterized protein YcbK (DUF882 family)
MSSPGEEFSSIQTMPPVRHQTILSQKSARLGGQTTADEQQSAIAAQAAEDAKLLNEQANLTPNTLNGQAASIEAAARKRNLAAELARTNSLLSRRNVAATQSSIYSNQQADADAQTLDAPQQVALNQTENGVAPGQGLNAAQNSIFSGQVEQPGRETASIPMPDANQVSEVQDLALAGKAIPPDTQVASADQAVADNLAAAQEDLEGQNVGKDRSLDSTVPSYNKALSDVEAEQPAAEPKKRRLTLADFFRRKQTKQVASFDEDRFGKKRTTSTQSIPNMQTASLSDQALPGVTTSAMMPVANAADDQHSADEDDDQPAGLMKLASLSGMTRMAPNGLWTQTDAVDVRCLRPQLVSMLKAVEGHYHRNVVVTSGYRDPRHNRVVGGAQHSLHTLCAAADIQIDGVSKWELANFLRSIPGRGGVGTYCHTESVHIDLGEERDWNWRCRRRRHG